MALTPRSDVTSPPGTLSPDANDVFAPKGRLGHALRLTRWGMQWERAARAFWPLVSLLALVFALFALGVVAQVPLPVLPWLGAATLIAIVAVAIRSGLRYRPVRSAEAVDRLDRTLPGRPLSALSDRAVIGGEGALWQAHLKQMSARAALARAVPPDAGLTQRDPFALRLAAIVALAMALIFGGVGQMGQSIAALAATVARPVEVPETTPSGPSWEGWAEPPAYTRRPTIYLNALRAGEVLELPKGSAVTFRLYGEGAAVAQTIGKAAGNDPQAPGFGAEKSGVIEVAGRRFDVTVLTDNAPTIRAGAAPVRRADGRMVQDYEAKDDHGVISAVAQIALDMPAVDRRFGLAIDPEPRKPVDLPLPLPRGADTRELKGQLVQDLSRHPWANLPVSLTLRAVDGIDQTGDAEPMQTVLPGRRFFQPLAAALIELRRDLLWSRVNAARSAEILRAVTWNPEGFVEQPLYLQLRGGVQILEQGNLSEKARDELAEALWQAAIQLEDGGLSDALERMKQAQEKLSEAIRNGASQDEIQRLMDELKEATEAYKQMLAEQGEQDPADRFTRNKDGQRITGDQIQEMMDEIQRLMNEGRMAEAQELLEQFNRMMENLQVTQGEGSGDGQQGSGSGGAMNRLADTLRDQQGLSDQAFRDMQEQFGQGNMGKPSGQGGAMADRQRELREELGQQQGLLPGQGSGEGDRARQRLDDAGRAMDDAERALRDGDTADALERQADAIEAMREGMRALGDMMNGDRSLQQPGEQAQNQQGQQQSEQPGADQRGDGSDQVRNPQATKDPLGRPEGTNGAVGGSDPGGDGPDRSRVARNLLDEIRRRVGQADRPQAELDYLGRLLERF